MAPAREPARPATSKRPRTDNPRAARDATTGQFVLLHAGDDVAEVPVSKTSFNRVIHRKRGLGRMISAYAEAAAKAKRTGKNRTVRAPAVAEATAAARQRPTLTRRR